MESALNIEGLQVSFFTDEGRVRAVTGASLTLARGETLGLVGESGCGKSVLAMSVLRLIPDPPGRVEGGRILFRGQDLLRVPAAELRAVRGKAVSMIFQEPATALSPLHRIGAQLVEAQRFHGVRSRAAARAAAAEWLHRVGIPDPAEGLRAWPHQLSGGMLQRVMIAMALMLDPEVLIADEPTTALDVTIQAQILDLLRALKKQESAVLLITHNMGVIREMCSRVAVMYAGEIVETGGVDELFARPLHPYTEALLRSMPELGAPGSRLPAIPGQVPSPLQFPAGCRFHDRCPCAVERCRREHPELERVGERAARCWLAPARAKTAAGAEAAHG